jgi:hypothetical protein
MKKAVTFNQIAHHIGKAATQSQPEAFFNTVHADHTGLLEW